MQKSLAMIVELRQTEPDNLELQKLEGRYNGRIAFHHSMMAQREMILWHETKAREWNESAVPYFQKAVESAKILSAKEPENKTSQRSVFVNESNYAEVIAQFGRADEALKLQREGLEYGQKQLVADPVNKEIKFEIAEDFLDLARTFVYKNDRKSAQENFGRGMNLMDELIADDPKNTEFTEFQFANLTSLYGDALIKNGKYDDALEVFRSALEKIADYRNDSEIVKQNRKEGVNRRFGDIYYFKAQKETAAMRRRNLTTARDFYRQSRDFLLPENQFFTEISEYINEKIAECEKERAF